MSSALAGLEAVLPTASDLEEERVIQDNTTSPTVAESVLSGVMGTRTQGEEIWAWCSRSPNPPNSVVS